MSLVLPRFGLGCAQFGNLLAVRSDEEVHATLEAAWDSGVRYFDTAPHYGLGLSERRLGAFLATKPRDEFVLSTKVGRLLRPNPAYDGQALDDNGFVVPADVIRQWDFSADGIRLALEESLERLGLDRVDVLLVHDPERSEIPGATEAGVAAVVGLREEGLADLVGIGSMTHTALATAIRSGADIVMAANCYTMLVQTVSPDVLAACDETGAQLIAAAVFNSGLLAAEPRAGATFDYAAVAPEMLARAQAIHRVCQDHGVELPVAAIHYPLLDARVAGVVVGAGTPEQTAGNLALLDAVVPEALWDDLDRQGLVPRCA